LKRRSPSLPANSATVLGRIAEALEVEATELVRAAPSKPRKKAAAEPQTR
jgi:hypothetical protein